MTKKEILTILLENSNKEIQEYAQKELQVLERKAAQSSKSRQEKSLEQALARLKMFSENFELARDIADRNDSNSQVVSSAAKKLSAMGYVEIQEPMDERGPKMYRRIK